MINKEHQRILKELREAFQEINNKNSGYKIKNKLMPISIDNEAYLLVT